MEQGRIRCAIYTRQSVARDTDFTSSDAQRDACLALIHAHQSKGWVPIEEHFDDTGKSGATMNRPALERLIERITAGGVERVVVHRLDRLTRSVADWSTLVGTFRRYETELSVVAGDIHLGDLAMSDLVGSNTGSSRRTTEEARALSSRSSTAA
jgi:DNA invertase Pin-like site-specific DNA recombinase